MLRLDVLVVVQNVLFVKETVDDHSHPLDLRYYDCKIELLSVTLHFYLLALFFALLVHLCEIEVFEEGLLGSCGGGEGDIMLGFYFIFDFFAYLVVVVVAGFLVGIFCDLD